MATALASQAGVHKSSLSWWLAAGLVGADIGTSVFYSTSILFPIVGFAAPFFIGLVAITMWLFKTTYQEGCSVNPVNGGAYSMVLATVGRRMALVVGSLTILSYLATAVVSALSGAQYLATLWSEPWPVWLTVLVASVPVGLFAALNLFGLKESTKLVFGIAAFHFLTLIAIDVYALWLALTQGAHWERLWTGFSHLPPQALILGFAAAFLGITGFESAAQVIEEIESPSHVAIKKVYLVIVALVSFTGPLSSMLALVLLSDAQIEQYRHAFLSGLAVVVGGKPLLVLLVLNACLTLFAAVNTAYAGATGLMTTMGKQGNLPAAVLKRWVDRHPKLEGFPFVALPFMILCLVMLMVFPGAVERLGEVYGMAFLGVMASYCLGVVLLRLHQPVKVARSPYRSGWTFKFKGKALPLAAVLGGTCLLVAELVLVVSSHEARDLLVQLFLGVLLLMVYYRLGQVENRMVKLPDLRLGLGRYRQMEQLPTLPTYVLCTPTADGARLVTKISYLLKKHGEGIEIVLFHAEDQIAGSPTAEALERLVSQQLEAFYTEKHFVLSVKVLPGSLLEVLPEYAKTRSLDAVYVATGTDRGASEKLKEHLGNELGLDVLRLEDPLLPKGPGVWFTQWAEGFRRGERDRPGGSERWDG